MCHVWCLLYVWFVPSSLFVFSSFFFGKPIGFTLAPCGGSQVLVGGKYGWTLCDRCIYFVLHTKVYYCRPARCSIANSPDVHMPYPHCRVCRRRRRVYDILLRRNLHACRRYTPSAECNWGWNICTAIRCVAVLVFVVFFFFFIIRSLSSSLCMSRFLFSRAAHTQCTPCMRGAMSASVPPSPLVQRYATSSTIWIWREPIDGRRAQSNWDMNHEGRKSVRAICVYVVRWHAIAFAFVQEWVVISTCCTLPILFHTAPPYERQRPYRLCSRACHSVIVYI